MTRKTTVSPMEDYKYSLDAADSREHLHLGYDNDETLPTGLLLSSSLHESGTSLGEEIRRRSSSSNNTASWEFLRGEGSCSRAHECSPEILRVMGSNESSMGDDDLVSSQTQLQFQLQLPPSTRPSPSPMSQSQTMTPRGGTYSRSSSPSSSALSSDSSFELPTPLRVRSQPIDIRPSPVNNTASVRPLSNSSHSDCDSAILLPRSPPQRVRVPSLYCPGCFTTQKTGTGIYHNSSGQEQQDCYACGRRSARLHPSAVKKRTGLLIQNHPANSDVSVLDLGPGYVDDENINETTSTTFARISPPRYGNNIRMRTKSRNMGEDGNDDDAFPSGSSGHGHHEEKHHLHRSDSLSNASSSSSLSESVSSTDNMSVASMGGTVTLFPIDEDLYEYNHNRKHDHNNMTRNNTRSGRGHGRNDVTITTPSTTTAIAKTTMKMTKEKRN